ncbi:uncharacterized protein LOC123296641 [Chrysoperla carnea]|uniref:uncharacterized protein LOC123296641 n=1 Tax=Chrysoperla carnea TaxID=189513 RepID=UPI001D07B75E|nr:uncharacterized protein LOC123296641 [Chrysoperla carnea]
MRTCVYCKTKATKLNNVSFFKFPSDERVLRLWIKNMGYESNWKPLISHRLCSKHFSVQCTDFRDKIFRLRKGSIPTIFGENNEIVDSYINYRQVIEKVEAAQNEHIEEQENFNFATKQKEMKILKDPLLINEEHIKTEQIHRELPLIRTDNIKIEQPYHTELIIKKESFPEKFNKYSKLIRIENIETEQYHSECIIKEESFPEQVPTEQQLSEEDNIKIKQLYPFPQLIREGNIKIEEPYHTELIEESFPEQLIQNENIEPQCLREFVTVKEESFSEAVF